MNARPTLMIRDPRPLCAAFVLLALFPVAAFAHAGGPGASTFAAGLAHPLGGADHVLAMVAVGLWAGLAAGRALWAMPASFVAAMLGGGVLGAAGLALPGVEPLILASVIVTGAAAALAIRPPLPLALAVLAVFGAAHGAAHGAEAPGAGFQGYAAGFVLATLALHLAGLVLAQALCRLRQGRLARIIGGGAAAGGLALAFG